MQPSWRSAQHCLEDSDQTCFTGREKKYPILAKAVSCDLGQVTQVQLIPTWHQHLRCDLMRMMMMMMMMMVISLVNVWQQIGSSLGKVCLEVPRCSRCGAATHSECRCSRARQASSVYTYKPLNYMTGPHTENLRNTLKPNEVKSLHFSQTPPTPTPPKS
jgi:hypothetical protein